MVTPELGKIIPIEKLRAAHRIKVGLTPTLGQRLGEALTRLAIPPQGQETDFNALQRGYWRRRSQQLAQEGIPSLGVEKLDPDILA